MTPRGFSRRYAAAMRWASDTGDQGPRNALLAEAKGTLFERLCWSAS